MLSPREKDVLRLIGEGKTSAEVARQLGVAESTVLLLVGQSVSRLGAARAEEIAAHLAHDRRSSLLGSILVALAGLAVSLFALGIVVASVGLVRGPSPSGPPSVSSAAATPAAGATAPPTPTRAPTTREPRPTVPRLPTLPPFSTDRALLVTPAPLPTTLPTIEPLPIPLPPLPTVPPLPTPRLP